MNSFADGLGTPGSSSADSESTAILDRIRWCVGQVSLGFDRWDDPHVHGPGLYFVVERAGTTTFADPMGANRWPVEDCSNVCSSADALSDAAESVALSCDGAVVVHSDGAVEEEMVRIKQLATVDYERTERFAYADWMGARHMSALETSTRPEILVAVTLSEEDGRMTVFRDGTYEDHTRDTLGSK